MDEHEAIMAITKIIGKVSPGRRVAVLKECLEFTGDDYRGSDVSYPEDRGTGIMTDAQCVAIIAAILYTKSDTVTLDDPYIVKRAALFMKLAQAEEAEAQIDKLTNPA